MNLKDKLTIHPQKTRLNVGENGQVIHRFIHRNLPKSLDFIAVTAFSTAGAS